MSKKIILLIIFVILLAANVMAIGVTPGRTTMDYVSGEVREVKFTVLNSENKNMDVIVLVQGELNESIAVSEVSFKMSENEASRDLRYTFTMPDDLSPGLHTSEVVVIQLPDKSSTSEAFIGAAIGVATQIYVNVPFPGKFAEADLNVIGPEDDGTITFVMPVYSRGDLDLVRVRGTVDVYTSLNEKIETLSTNEVFIQSGKKEEIVARWDASKVPPGKYKAVATIIYDENTVNLEKEFSVGKRLLEVSNIEVNDFSLGEIAKFEILVENKWSEPIVGAYAQMLVFNNDEEIMADFKSATYEIDPLTKALMVAFWDTGGVREGTYDSSLFLKYGDSSEQQELQLEVKESEINIIGVGFVISSEKGQGNSLFDSSLTIILVVGIVVLVLINVLWFLVLRKKLKK